MIRNYLELFKFKLTEIKTEKCHKIWGKVYNEFLQIVSFCNAKTHKEPYEIKK